MKRVKNYLKEHPNTSPWVKNERPKDGSFWEEDLVRYIPGLGETTATVLLAYSIQTVAKMIKKREELSNSSIRSGISAKIQKLESTKRGMCPFVIIDYTKQMNLYEARYGLTWKDSIKKTSVLLPFVRISDMILYMSRESHRVMSGIKHKDDW